MADAPEFYWAIKSYLPACLLEGQWVSPDKSKYAHLEKAFAEGKQIQWFSNGKWTTLELGTNDPLFYSGKPDEYRIVEPNPAWTMPKPPEGREWHRDGWTQDMLPEGYRPLLLGADYGDYEISQDFGETWIKGDKLWNCTPTMRGVFYFYRTLRPLPEPSPVTAYNPADAQAVVEKTPGKFCNLNFNNYSYPQ